MTSRLRERHGRNGSVSARRSWSLQPVSKFIRQEPIEYLRRKAWTATPVGFGNGISAVTSLCLCDEASAGGPPLLISGDEDGGVSVQRVRLEQKIRKCRDDGGSSPGSGWLQSPDLQRARLHSSSVNTIKILADKRGFVCAGDDGVLTAVSSLDVSTETDIRRATVALTGHSGFVTDCDTTETGHAILSSSTDGRMHLWDPGASNTPVATVVVGRPVTSACFSAGDPYALLCTPEVRTGCRDIARNAGCGRNINRGGMENDLIQIWDLRSLRCFKDSLPAEVATAFGEDTPASHRGDISMHPPPARSPQERTSSVWSDNTSCGLVTTPSSMGSTSAQVPSWLSAALGSASAASPTTPLLRKSAWTSDDESSGAEPLPFPSAKLPLPSQTGGRLSWCDSESDTPRSVGKENNLLPERDSMESPSTPSVVRSLATAQLPCSFASSPTRMTQFRVGDQPAALLGLTSTPASGCLHHGKGRTWVPGGLKSWQPNKRRFRRGDTQECARAQCDECCSSSSSSSSSSTVTSGYSVRVSSDGRSILVACQDRTVTLFDTQSHEVLYRFGHPRLSTRARPILVEGGPRAGVRARDGGREGIGRGDIFAGTTDGEVRSWRIGSQFPNRVFKPMRHHKGFDVCSLAASVDGTSFASADSSGAIYVQSATLEIETNDLSPGEHRTGD